MKAAYADPPYLGCGAKHYGDRHEAAAEYDTPEAHRRLKYRLNSGRVKFWYELDRPLDAVEEAFREIAEEVQEKTGYPLLYGTRRA